MFRSRPKPVAPPPPPRPAAPTPGKVPIPTNLPKMSGPLGRVGTPPPPQQPTGRGGLFGGSRGSPAPAPAPAPIPRLERPSPTQAIAQAAQANKMKAMGLPDPIFKAAPPRPELPQGRPVGTTISGAEAKKLGLGMKKGGAVKKMASGGSVSSASKRADGCAIKGKTKGRMV